MDMLQWYQANFGVDLNDYVASVPQPTSPYQMARVNAQRARDPFAPTHRVILPTREALVPYIDSWASLHGTTYSMSNCAHATVGLIFDRRGAGRQLDMLDALEITHAVLGALHGDEYLEHDRVSPAVTALLMTLLPPLWHAIAPVYSLIAESGGHDSFVSGVHFDSWKGYDMVVLVETFTPGHQYASASPTPAY